MAYSPMQLANAFIQAGELDDALDVLEAHLAQHPDDDTARHLRAEILSRDVQPERLRQALADLRALSMTSADDFIRQAALHLRLDEPADAQALLAQGHAAYPADERLLESYVHLLVTQGDYSTAQTVAASFPAGWRRNRWLGDIAVAQGDDPTALPHYSAALDALREHYAIATDSPAAVIKDEGITDAAALTISAIYAALLLSRAHIHRRMGNSDSAQQDYAAAAILLPDDPTIRIFQAMLAEDGAARAQLRTIFADTPPRRHADLRALLQDDAPHLLDFDGG